jgi:RecA-family ATPase
VTTFDPSRSSKETQELFNPFGKRRSLKENRSNKPKSLDFVFPGMLAGTVGSIVSPGGAGKSFLALQLCAQVAGSSDLLGIGDLSPGNSLYLAAEDPEPIIDNRLYDFGSHMSDEEAELVDPRLDIYSLMGECPNLLDDRWIDAIKGQSENRRLVVIDTFRRFHTEDENQGGPMAEVLGRLESICKATGCAILFMHHANKGSAFNDDGEAQQACRGSSVITDNSRWQGFLSKMSKDEAKKYGIPEECRNFFVRFGASKQNYGSPLSEVWLKRHDGGILVSTILEVNGEHQKSYKGGDIWA